MKKRLFSLLCLLGTVAGLFAGDTAYLSVIRLICSLISLMTVGTVFIWLIVWMG